MQYLQRLAGTIEDRLRETGQDRSPLLN